MPSDALETTISAEEQDAIRARIRQVMATRGMAQTDVSRQIGIPHGTFSPWLTGKYGGRTSPIAEQALKWLNTLDAAERTSILAPRAPAFVATRTGREIFDALEHAQHMPEFVVVTGAPGVGKTSAAKAYKARSSNVWMVTAEPAMSTPRGLLDELGDAVGVQERGLSSHRLSRAVARRMTGTGGLVLIDEGQHLPSQVLDQLRVLYDLAGIGIALMGNETIFARLEGGTRAAQYAQLFSRVGMRVQRPRPLKDDIDALLTAWGVEGKRERTLMHAVARKPGALRNLTKCLQLAHMTAGGEGAEAMDETHILMAAKRLGIDVQPQAVTE